MDTLFPVILSVPPDKQQLKGREKVHFLSHYARVAAERSAKKSGIRLAEFIKNPKGVPLPAKGYWWSVSHKPEYVAGVVSRGKIGIDLEKIRPYTAGLEKKVADEAEWAIYPVARSDLLFRYWTAKEAVLKLMGIGLAGLSSCKIQKETSDNHMTVRFQDQRFQVEHITFDNHIAAVVTDDHARIEWIFDDPEEINI
ncbi:MAG: 4'-phosphopantetheinyl transferase superfamily protein [Pseudomonadota bacterium]